MNECKFFTTPKDSSLHFLSSSLCDYFFYRKGYAKFFAKCNAKKETMHSFICECLNIHSILYVAWVILNQAIFSNNHRTPFSFAECIRYRFARWSNRLRERV